MKQVVRALAVFVLVAASRAGTVMVTATRTRQGAQDIPASVTVISRTNVVNRAAVGVDELFKRVGGVDLQGSGVPGSPIKLNLRGLTPGYQSKRLLMLVDGRRVNEQYQGNVEFAVVPADGLDRIEVLRGPASALYGSGAMGGVVQLFTRRGRDMAAAGELGRLRLAAGSHGTSHARFDAGGSWRNSDAYVTGSFVDTDGYLENADGSARDWSARNIQGNAGWMLSPQTEVRLFGGAYEGSGTDANSEREVDKDFEHLQVAWNRDRNHDAGLIVNLWRSGERNVYDWFFPGRGVYDQETLAGDLQQSLWVLDRHQVTTGVEVRRDAVDIDEVAGPIDEHTSVVGIYAQDELHLTDALRLLAGLRYDNTGGYGSEWSPRVGMLWRPIDDAELFGSFNVAHRAPGLSDRFVITEFNGARFEGNPDLGPETLNAYELGARCRPAGGVTLELVGFLNAMDDSFDFSRDPDGVFRIRNVTRSRTMGVETTGRMRATDVVTVFASCSYTDGTYRESDANPAIAGNQLAYLARNKATAGIDAAWKRLSQSLTCRYVGKRYGDATNTADNRMDAYVTVDWRGRLHVTEHLDLTLNVDNLFDSDHNDFPTHPQPGLTVMAGVEAVF